MMEIDMPLDFVSSLDELHTVIYQGRPILSHHQQLVEQGSPTKVTATSPLKYFTDD